MPLPVTKTSKDSKRKGKSTQTGLLGVTFDIHRNKWKARFHYNKKERFIGRFDTADEAASAYDQAVDIVQRMQNKTGTARKRAKNFPDQTFQDPGVELRVMELIDGVPQGDEDQADEEPASPPAADAAKAPAPARDLNAETAAAASAALLESLMSQAQPQAGARCVDSGSSSGGGSCESQQQQQRLAGLEVDQQCDPAALLAASQTHSPAPAAGVTKADPTASTAAAMHGSSFGGTQWPAQHDFTADYQLQQPLPGGAFGPAAAAGAGRGRGWVSNEGRPQSFSQAANLLLDPQYSSSLDLLPGATDADQGITGAAAAARFQALTADDIAAAIAPADHAGSTPHPSNGRQLWHRYSGAGQSADNPAAAAAAAAAAAGPQLHHSPFAAAHDLLGPSSYQGLSYPQQHQYQQQQQRRRRQQQQRAEQDDLAAMMAASQPSTLELRAEDMDALLLSLLEGSQPPLQQQQQPDLSFTHLLGCSAPNTNLQQEHQPRHNRQSAQLQQGHGHAMLHNVGMPVAAGEGMAQHSQVSGAAAIAAAVAGGGSAARDAPVFPAAAAAAGGGGSSSLQQEVLRQQRLLQQAAATHSQYQVPTGTGPLGSTAPLQTQMQYGHVPFGPTASAAAGAAPPLPAMQMPAGQNGYLRSSSLGAFDCPSKALCFAAVCIQAVGDLKAQLRLLGPATCLGHWLFTLRQELQAQVTTRAISADVSLAATLMMQHLALLLSDAGAFAGGSSDHAAAVAAHAGRSFGVAVCEGLQGALWLLHGHLNAAQGRVPVADVLQRWVANLRMSVSSHADAAVLQLITMV